MKIGYIGFGKSTTRYHLPYVLIRDNIKVKIIYNRSRKPELEKKYNKHDINFTDNIDDILNDEEIQLVVICTPADTHYDYAKKCLNSNKNVLVEKPFCRTKEEAEELLNLAKEKKLTIIPYQNRRFDSDFLTLKEVIKNGYVGKIVEIESHFDNFRPEDDREGGPPFEGAFYGLGVHTIDQMISLFGRPDYVSYDIRHIRNKKAPHDLYDVALYYGDLKIIVKTSHTVKIPYPKFIMHGKKGSFVKYGIDRQEEFLKNNIIPEVKGFGLDVEKDYGRVSYIDENGNDIEKIFPTIEGDYGRVYDNLYNVIINGAEKLVSDEEILLVIEILEKAFEQESPSLIKM